MGPLSSLTPDLQIQIFSQLPPTDIARARRVSKGFQNFVDNHLQQIFQMSGIRPSQQLQALHQKTTRTLSTRRSSNPNGIARRRRTSQLGYSNATRTMFTNTDVLVGILEAVLSFFGASA